MANVRLHRTSCELGRLPRVCICCGAPATRFVRRRFERAGTFRDGFFAYLAYTNPWVGLWGILREGILYDPLSHNKITLPVPVCEIHRWHLNRFAYVVWALSGILGIAAAILVPYTIFSFFGNHDVDRAKAESVMITATLLLFPVVVAVLVLVRIATVRTLGFTDDYIDLMAVAPGFMEAVQRTSTALTPSQLGHAMGRPLPSGTGMKTAAMATGILLAVVCGFCLLGLAGTSFTKWQRRQHLAQLVEESRKRGEQRIAEMTNRMAGQNRGSPRPPGNGTTSNKLPATAPPSTPPRAPNNGFGFAPVESDKQPGFIIPETHADSAASEATGRFGAPPPTESPKRIEAFKVAGRQRFPPASREIRDTSELKAGMEVWASAGLTWYRSTVVRVENRMMARIRMPASAAVPERMLPAMQIRLPTDEAASGTTP